MNLRVLVLCTLTCLAISCVSPNLILSSELKNNTSVYEVKGKNTITFKRVVRFGGYSTSRVRKGWVNSYDIPLFVNLKEARQKLSFVQHDSTGNSAEVYCVGNLRQQEVRLIKDFLSVELQNESNFTGSILPNVESTADHWDFSLSQPDGGFHPNETYGVAENIDGQRIEMKAVRNIEHTNQVFKEEVYGFEFFKDGNSIGAVSLLNNGKVWMRNDLDADTKLVVACLSNALMLRDNLKKRTTENNSSDR